MIIDVEEHFVKATYFLEGDGRPVFSCYEGLQAIAEACQALLNQLSMKIRIREQLPWNRVPRVVYSQWFLRKFNVDLKLQHKLA